MLRLTLPLPPSVNHAYRPGLTREGKATIRKREAPKKWEEKAGKLILKARTDQNRTSEERSKLKGKGIEPPIVLEAWFYSDQKGRWDADNRCKLLQDLLSRILGFDDSLITDVFLHKRFDAANPRCEVALLDGPRAVEMASFPSLAYNV